jgi:hypothetical protein
MRGGIKSKNSATWMTNLQVHSMSGLPLIDTFLSCNPYNSKAPFGLCSDPRHSLCTKYPVEKTTQLDIADKFRMLSYLRWKILPNKFAGHADQFVSSISLPHCN